MTDPQQPIIPPKPELVGRTAARWWKSYALVFAIALICGIFLTVWGLQEYSKLFPAAAPGASLQTPAAVVNFVPVAPPVSESRSDTTPAASAPLTTIESSPSAGVEKDEGLRQQNADIARLQNDVVSLSGALAAMQAEVKHSEDLSGQIQKTAQATQAILIDFMQLRSMAENGRPFSAELARFRGDSGDNSAVQQQINLLAPLAAEATPSLAALRAQLSDLEPAVIRANAQAKAQNWWEKILANIKSLVIIRHQQGDRAEDSLAPLAAGLDSADYAKANAEFAALPPSTQAALKNWQAALADRAKIDQTLQAIADLLAGRATMSPTDLPRTQP